MNMIICSKPCKYQKNGCCEMKGTGEITNIKGSLCKFYYPRQMDEKYASAKQTNPAF